VDALILKAGKSMLYRDLCIKTIVFVQLSVPGWVPL
jgi:hypothetical protein